jgi:MFS-type transporter involved in bile tolerance (Atg22 family)
MINASPNVKKRSGWLTVLVIILVLIILKPALILSFNIFLFLHKLLYGGTTIPFEVWWTVLGLLTGAVCGAWVAKRRYNLAVKWVWYPAGGLALFVLIFFLVNKV